MKLIFQNRYFPLSDKEIVVKIITIPYNEEAAVYLLYDRYSPKFRKLTITIYGNFDWYDDCVDDLFEYLKGKELDWQKLRSFQWRCKFSSWIGVTARNRFLEIKPYLIGKIDNPISIDGDDEAKPKVQIPDEGIEDYERREQKIMLMEAIHLLKDPDQKFVIKKTLQGYNSTEIAELLTKQWKVDNIKKYNNSGELVIPSAAYVDVRRQRAKAALKEIITKQM